LHMKGSGARGRMRGVVKPLPEGEIPGAEM